MSVAYLNFVFDWSSWFIFEIEKTLWYLPVKNIYATCVWIFFLSSAIYIFSVSCFDAYLLTLRSNETIINHKYIVLQDLKYLINYISFSN